MYLCNVYPLAGAQDAEIEIFLHPASGGVVKRVFAVDATIDEVAEGLEDGHGGLGIYNQSGFRYDGGSTLRELHAQSGNSFYVGGRVQVYVDVREWAQKRRLDLDFWVGDTIEHVKMAIRTKTDIALERMSALYHGHLLLKDDGSTLWFYGVDGGREKNVLDLVLDYQVTVKLPDGKKFALGVTSSDSVDAVVDKVLDSYGTPTGPMFRAALTFGKEKLVAGRTLGFYGIGPDAELVATEVSFYSQEQGAPFCGTVCAYMKAPPLCIYAPTYVRNVCMYVCNVRANLWQALRSTSAPATTSRSS